MTPDQVTHFDTCHWFAAEECLFDQQAQHAAYVELPTVHFVGYEGVQAFEVYQRHTETLTTIGVSFYI